MVKVAASPGEINGVRRLTRSGTGGVRGPPADDAPRSLKHCHGHAPSSPRAAHGTASGVRSPGGDILLRWEGRCPFGAGLSCFAPSPGGAGSRPFGLRSLSRAPRRHRAGSQGAWGRGRRGAAWAGGRGASRPAWEAGRRCQGAPCGGRSPTLADQRSVRAGRRIVVPDELPRKHHALDAAAVGEHGAKEVGRARGRCALAVATEPDDAVGLRRHRLRRGPEAADRY